MRPRGQGKQPSRSWVLVGLLPATTMTFYCCNVGVDLVNHVAWLPDGPLALRAQEVRLLRLLSAAACRLIPTHEVLSTLYGGIPDEHARIRLKTLIADIRRRLGPQVGSRLRVARGIGLILYVDQAGKRAGDLSF